jgi:hypothetical protein
LVRNTLVKESYVTTRKREKHLFGVDDLVNVLFSLWTEDDTIFIHECMRDQMTFLLLASCFTGARVGASFHNGKAEEKLPDGKVDKFVFEGLTWKVRENLNASCGPDAQPETDDEPGCFISTFSLSLMALRNVLRRSYSVRPRITRTLNILCTSPSSPHPAPDPN